MVPTGTLSTMSSPSRPLLLLPSPCRPRSALYSGLKRKWTRVLWRSLASINTSPPRPPSPPEGPPRGTNFSRRKAMHPLPPSPAFTRIFASSINIFSLFATNKKAETFRLLPCSDPHLCSLSLFSLKRDYGDEAPHIAAVAELDGAGDLSEQGVV